MTQLASSAPRRIRVLCFGNDNGRGALRGQQATPGIELEVEEATSVDEVLDRLRRGSFHALLVEAEPTSEQTTRLLDAVCKLAPEVAVVVRGGNGSAEEVRSAIRAGARDCIPPQDADDQRLTTSLVRALEQHRAYLELKSALSRSEAGEARFQAIVEQNADGIVIVSPNGVIRFVNPAAEALFQRSREQLTGEPFGFPLANGQPAELDLIRRDGTTVVAELRVATIPWEGGEAYLVALRDVTDRKQAEQRSRELVREQAARAQAEQEQRFYRFLAEAADILDSSLDYAETLRRVAFLVVPQLADWCVIDIVEDDGTIHRLGVTDQDPRRGELMSELERSYRLDPQSPQPAGQVLRTGEPVLVEEVSDEWLASSSMDPRHLEILRGLGTYSVLSVPMVTRRRTSGVMTLVSGAPERRFDLADLHLAEELARRAAVAVENARLYRDAQEANRAKTDFLAVMSHELRTPLNAIMGYSDILLGEITGPINERQADNLRRVKFASKHLLQIIEEILSYARMESGREKLNVEAVDVADLVAEVVSVAEPLARERNLQFLVEAPGPGLEVSTDVRKVRQILLNLLTNAAKFTDDGHVRLVAEVTDVELVFRVEDTGQGIDPDKLERIFEPFWQVEQPRTRRSGGTGLGLSIAKRLAALLQGELTVHSVPGDGSVFTVRLPRHLERPDAREESSPID